MKMFLKDRGICKEHGIDVEEDKCECPCGDIARGIIFATIRIIVLLATLPLHSFPVCGQILYFGINGWLNTWDLLSDFIPHIGHDSVGSQAWFALQNFMLFAKLGAVAVLLEVLPVGPLFKFPNALGTALLFEQFAKHYKAP